MPAISGGITKATKIGRVLRNTLANNSGAKVGVIMAAKSISHESEQCERLGHACVEERALSRPAERYRRRATEHMICIRRCEVFIECSA
jgi:hypothetical protein